MLRLSKNGLGFHDKHFWLNIVIGLADNFFSCSHWGNKYVVVISVDWEQESAFDMGECPSCQAWKAYVPIVQLVLGHNLSQCSGATAFAVSLPEEICTGVTDVMC